jgi:hypothetical protein
MENDLIFKSENFGIGDYDSLLNTQEELYCIQC